MHSDLDRRSRLRALLQHGCGLPAARDLATALLARAERNALDRARRGLCTSGCTAPVTVTDPEPLCARCAEEMTR